MYHSISQHATPKFKPFAVSPVLFAEQMAYLHRHAFTPITVTQLAQALSQVGTSLPEHPVVITFDDGFADFFTDALPVLMRYNFTATLYVTTGFINGTSGWLQHEGEASRPMLTWHQLAEICAQGIECGTHSHSHPQLDTLPLSVATHEIVQSKKLIEEHLGVAVTSFAYPFGYYTAVLQKQVQAAGFTSACAVKFAMSSPSTDLFALARLMIEADTNIDDFAALLHRGSSSVFTTMYIRARTPVWQVVRRSSASVKRHLSGGILAQ
ncbi:MAG TPA: polysaccharide deacetylase [Ktedonobacter sp.]|nr:polysaccharide deacetylase [Ktedonobacter sp.]